MKDKIGTKLRQKLRLSPTRTVALGFLLIISIGALLLCLPIATRSREPAGFINALFTATSATCVTGLVVRDTFTYWSYFGQIVILLLIQIGGLGFMAVMSIITFALRRNIGLGQRLLMMQSLSLNDITGVVRLMRHILVGTLIVEGAGAVILSVRFSFDYGILMGIYKGVFHAVSAMCNAGFDLMGDRGAYSGFTSYVADPVVNLTVMGLIVVGGLGFFVWEDLYRHARSRAGLKKLHLHTRLVLSITGILIAVGAVLFFILEKDNPATMGNLNLWQRAMAALFQAITPRTAGFNTIDQASMTGSSKIITMFLMFIGGSPGSTAGGIKTVTAAVVIINAFVVFRGRQDIRLRGRTLPSAQVQLSSAIAVMGVLIVAMAVLVMTFSEEFSLMEQAFECVSAFGTVGLSLGITPTLGPGSLVLLMVLMYLGRVGIMTLAIAFMSRRQPKIKYPECRIIIG